MLKSFLLLTSLMCTTVLFAGKNEKTPATSTNMSASTSTYSPTCGLPAPDNSSYNAPAQITTSSPCHIWTSGSFIYWQAIEADLEMGDVVDASLAIQTKGFDFTFKPGFKVDLGWSFNYDKWDLFAEYTWYHTGNMTTSLSESGSYNTTTQLFAGNVIVSKLQPLGVSPKFLPVLNTVEKMWNVKTDFVDLMLARSYYVGSQLKFRPSFGARGAWARQNLDIFEASNQSFSYDAINNLAVGTTTTSLNKIISSGGGLKAALNMDWMLGAGFKMFGYGAFDLLYTHYKLFSLFTSDNNASNTTRTITDSEKISVLRPHSEMEFGFAYGTYFDNCRWYFDLTASYDFQIFWNYNMFLVSTTSPIPVDEFYLHGLKVAASLSF